MIFTRELLLFLDPSSYFQNDCVPRTETSILVSFLTRHIFKVWLCILKRSLTSHFLQKKCLEKLGTLGNYPLAVRSVEAFQPLLTKTPTKNLLCYFYVFNLCCIYGR